MPFDPTQPFELLDPPAPRFDPTKPFEVIDDSFQAQLKGAESPRVGIEAELESETAVQPPTTAEQIGHAARRLTQGASDVAGNILQVPAIVGTRVVGGKQEEQPLFKLGELIKQNARQRMEFLYQKGDTRAELLRSNPFTEDIPSGVGSSLAFLVSGGPAGRLLGSARGGVAATGALAGAGSGAEEARAYGAAPNKEFISSLLNAGLGLTEAVGIGSIAARLDKASGGAFSKGVRSRLVAAGQDVLKETVEEALQEGVQSLGEDVIAKSLAGYDPERELGKELWDRVQAGGLSGALLSGLASAGTIRRGRVQEPTKELKPGDVIPGTEGQDAIETRTTGQELERGQTDAGIPPVRTDRPDASTGQTARPENRFGDLVPGPTGEAGTPEVAPGAVEPPKPQRVSVPEVGEVNIQYPVGSIRSGKDKGGNEWSVTMPAHYGEIVGTKGKDKDRIDIYVAPDPQPGPVFVVNQVDPETGKFDEHKVFYGFPSVEAAHQTYDAAFSDGTGPQRRESFAQFTPEQFKAWLKEGDKAQPAAADLSEEVAKIPDTPPAPKAPTALPPKGVRRGKRGEGGQPAPVSPAPEVPKQPKPRKPEVIQADLDKARARLADLEARGVEAISPNDPIFQLVDNDQARALEWTKQTVRNHIEFFEKELGTTPPPSGTKPTAPETITPPAETKPSVPETKPPSGETAALPKPTEDDLMDRNKFIGEDYAGPPNSVVIQVRGLNTVPIGNGKPVVLPIASTMEDTAKSVHSGYSALIHSKDGSMRESVVRVLDKDGRAVFALRWTPDKMEVAPMAKLREARKGANEPEQKPPAESPKTLPAPQQEQTPPTPAKADDAKLLDLLGAKHDLTGQQAELVLKAFRAVPADGNAESLQKEYLRVALPADIPAEVGLGKVASIAGAREVLADLREASPPQSEGTHETGTKETPNKGWKARVTKSGTVWEITAPDGKALIYSAKDFTTKSQAIAQAQKDWKPDPNWRNITPTYGASAKPKKERPATIKQQFDKLALDYVIVHEIEHDPIVSENVDTIHAGARSTHNAEKQRLRRVVFSALGLKGDTMDNADLSAAIPKLKEAIAKREAELSTPPVDETEADRAEFPEGTNTDFLPPEETTQETYPTYPDLPKKQVPGSNIFKDFSDAVSAWKVKLSEWLKTKPENKAIIWEEAEREYGKGNVKALTRNVGDKPWRVTTYINRDGQFMPWGHNEYATREEALAEEGKHPDKFHDKMPGKVMTEQEIQGYKLMDDIEDKSSLVWYELKPGISVSDLQQKLRGSTIIGTLVRDSLRNGRIAFTEALDTETDPKRLEWLGLKEIVKPFSVDETLIWKAPGTGEDVRVNYRGPLGSDQAVVVPPSGLQMAVQMDALRRPVKETSDTVKYPAFADPLNTADMNVTTSREIRKLQAAKLKELYSDYNAKRHDAFVERYNYQLQKARQAAYEKNRGIEPTVASAKPDLELAAPETVEQQKARLAAEEAAAKAKSDKEKIAEAAAKPLIGKVGDIGQTDLLGGGDLFSTPTKPDAESGGTPTSEAPSSGANKPASQTQDKPFGSDNKIVSTERAEKLKQRIKDKFKGTGGNISMLGTGKLAKVDPELFSDAVQLGAYYIEGGYHRFADWSAKMLEDLGEAIKDHLKSIYETARITIESPGSESSVGRSPGLQPGIRPPSDRIVSARPELTKAADETVIPDALRQHLDSHQRQGAATAITSLNKRGGFLLADGTGAGKTRQALTVAENYRAQGKAVVIVTKSETIKQDWAKKTFGGSYYNDSKAMGVDVKLVRDGDVKPGEIGITTYQNLSDVARNTNDNTVLIFDESHALKNDSQQARHGLRAIQRAASVMFMSATPADKPEHIYYLAPMGIMEGKSVQKQLQDLGMKLVTVDKMVKEGNRFVKRAVTFWTEDQTVSDQERNERFSALFDRMTEQGAMLKREIGMDGVHVQVLRLNLPPEAHETMDRILKFFDADHVDDLQGLKKAIVLGHQRRQQEPYKNASTVMLTQRELAAGRQVVIFVSRVNESEVGKWVKVGSPFPGGEQERVREVLMRSEGTAKSLREALEDAGIHDIAEIHGNADQASLEAMDDFQKGKKRVVIATIESGGTGINLDDTLGNRPRSMIVVTAPFDAVGNVQAAGRIWRLKTLSGANLFYLFGDTDVDQWNADIIGSKMATLGAVVEGQVRRLDVSNPESVTTDDYHEQVQRPAKQEESAQTTIPFPKLDWKPFKTRAGKDKFVAEATPEFWTWWNASGKKDNTEGVRVSKWQDKWQVWSDRDRTISSAPPAEEAKPSDTANKIADSLDNLKSGRKPGDLQLFGVIPAVWDRAVSIAQGIIRAGGKVADAVAAAIAHIKANHKGDWDEAGAREALAGSSKKVGNEGIQVTEEGIQSEGDEVPAPPPPEQWVPTQVQGKTWYVPGREQLTPETAARSVEAAEKAFAEAGFDTERRTFVDPLDQQTKSILFIPQTEFAEERGRKLAEILEREIREQLREGKAADHTAMLINSVRENFDMADGAFRQMSEGTRNRLFAIAQEEASIRGRALRALGNYKADLIRVSRNVDVYLNRLLHTAFGGDEIKVTADSVRKQLRGALTDEEIDKLAELANDPKHKDRIRAAIRRAIANVKAKMRPRTSSKWWEDLERLMSSGILDDTELLKRIAAKRGWKIPTDADVEEMRKLADREQELRTPTESELAGTEDDPVKRARVFADVESATREERLKLQKRLAVMWSEMSRPVSLRHAWAQRQNNARFLNELFTANILLRASFATKQAIDVLTQWFDRMPDRALSQAMTLRHNDIANGNPTRFWKDAYESLTDIYKDSVKSLPMALAKARAALAGRVEIRNVDRLMGTISALDRLWKKGEDAAKDGSHGLAFIYKLLATVGFSYKVAGAFDFLHGTPAEWNERRAGVIEALRNDGVDPAAAKVQADWVMDSALAEYPDAVTMAKSILDARGVKSTPQRLREDAWNMVERRQYQKIEELGLPMDAIRENSEMYRQTLGWNERELRGPGGVAGGLVSAVGRGFERIGIPLAMGRFGNAIAIGINRQLHRTPFYALANTPFMPGSGAQPSAWHRTTRDMYERRIQAAKWTALGGMLLGAAWMGLAKVWLRPPDDKEERELWEAQGHKAGTVEFDLGNGEYAVFSLNTGPFAMAAPYLAAGGALNDLTLKREKQQKKIDEEAAKRGETPSKLPPPDMAEWFGVAAQAAQGAILGQRTASGLFYTVTDYGTPNVKKFAASQFTPLVPGLPAMQEVSRMSGVVIDPKKADLVDFLMPLPTSKARKYNMLGDPVGTADDVQRVIQILTGGNALITGGRQDDAYKALYVSGYRPPSVDPNKGHSMNGEYRPFTSSELERYTAARSRNLRSELEQLGEGATPETARAAYQRADAAALAEVGVTPHEHQRRAGRQPGSRAVAISGPSGAAVAVGQPRILRGRRLGRRLASGLRRARLRRGSVRTIRRGLRGQPRLGRLGRLRRGLRRVA